MQPKIDPKHADVKHSHSIEDHAAAQAGEYQHQEYPKVIGRDEDGREVVADSAEHEEQLRSEKVEPYFVGVDLGFDAQDLAQHFSDEPGEAGGEQQRPEDGKAEEPQQ